MTILTQLFDIVLHLRDHIGELIAQFGPQIYTIFFLIIFCETGLVLTPFLPGDSLLFAAGALAGAGLLNLGLLIIILFAAAFLGDNTNYFIGNFIGHKLIESKRRLIKKEYLDKTHAFYEKHGGKTVIIARFVPIIRTFAPFVAGLGAMTYKRFLTFCVVGNILWICGFTILGYIVGNNHLVKENFTFVIF